VYAGAYNYLGGQMFEDYYDMILVCLILGLGVAFGTVIGKIAILLLDLK
jgi:hypothetical protein